MRTYQGSCHCGLIQFAVTATLDYLGVCDCSICRRRGALMYAVEEDQLKLLTALDKLTVYTFGTHTARDYFCPRCGVLPFRRPRRAPHMWGINVRCLDGVDLNAIPIKNIAGSRLA